MSHSDRDTAATNPKRFFREAGTMERARWTNSKQFRQKKSLPDPKRRRTERTQSRAAKRN